MNAALDVDKLVPAWQALTSAAPLSHIDSEADYEETTAPGRARINLQPNTTLAR